jgi:hypothetical protein
VSHPFVNPMPDASQQGQQQGQQPPQQQGQQQVVQYQQPAGTQYGPPPAMPGQQPQQQGYALPAQPPAFAPMWPTPSWPALTPPAAPAPAPAGYSHPSLVVSTTGASTAGAQTAPSYQTPAGHQPGTGQPSGQAGTSTTTGTTATTSSGQQGGSNDTFNYPENTALAEMTDAQRAEYWRHKARKHEDRVKGMGDYDELKAKAGQLDQVVAANQTDHQRAVEEARRQGAADVISRNGGQLVEQWMRVAAYGRLPEEAVNGLLAGLDRSKFLTSDGGVDAGKVWQFVGSIAPAGLVGSPQVAQVQTGAVQAVPAGGVPGAVGHPQYQVQHHQMHPGGVVTGQGYQPTVYPGQQPVVQVGAPFAQPMSVPPVLPSGQIDFGQGRPAQAGPTGLEAGAAIAAARFKKNNPPAAS